jgi:hypothetical protein
MLRALTLFALATSLSAMTIWATAYRPADNPPLLVERASPRLAFPAMTIL